MNVQASRSFLQLDFAAIRIQYRVATDSFDVRIRASIPKEEPGWTLRIRDCKWSGDHLIQCTWHKDVVVGGEAKLDLASRLWGPIDHIVRSSLRSFRNAHGAPHPLAARAADRWPAFALALRAAVWLSSMCDTPTRISRISCRASCLQRLLLKHVFATWRERSKGRQASRRDLVRRLVYGYVDPPPRTNN